MALSLQSEQKEHLSYFLSHAASDLSRALANISTGDFTNCKNESLLSDEENATRALLKFLIDVKRLELTEKDFQVQVTALTGLTDDKVQLAWNFLNSETAISELITSDEYKFRDLEWRLEAKVATRFLHSIPSDPKIVLKLHLDLEKTLHHRLILSEATQENSTKELLIECNANSLVHIIDQLESAKTAVSHRQNQRVIPS